MADTDWRATWESYNRRRRQYAVAMVALVLGFLALVLIDQKVPLYRHSYFFIAVLGVLLGGATITTQRLFYFRCPRCSKLFAWRLFYQRILTKKCLHCGIRVGEDPRSA